jgi:hypothetical protein
MAKVKLHPMIKSLHGKCGDLVFKKGKNGKQIVTRVPDMSNVQWSQSQTQNRSTMGEASKLASQALKDPELRLFFEELAWKENKRRKKKDKEAAEISTFNLAVSYYRQGGQLPES